MAFAISMSGGVGMPPDARLVEKMQIDDAVGAVGLHGVVGVGVWGLVAVGIFASGYPAPAVEGPPVITIHGQVVGAMVMVVAGFVPGYLISLLLQYLGLPRALREAGLVGLDKAKVPVVACRKIVGEMRSPASPAE